MFNSAVLEVAIGIAMVYLLLSLVCSAINEFTTRLFQWRSTTLRQGITTMLDDLQVLRNAAPQNVASLFYDSPLIRGLTQIRGPAGGSVLPTYIAAPTFVQTLLDLVAPSNGAGPQTLADIRASVAALPASNTKTSLLGMLDRAGNDLAQAQASIQHWFDSTMEEVSACYRAWANTILFFVAMVVCAATNADSVQIANHLWNNPTLRTALASSAEQFVKDESAAKMPPKEQLEKIQAGLAGIDIPLGWKEKEFYDLFRMERALGTLEKVFGIFFTTVAVSLGAPFWFDLLNKLVNFRSAANKPKSATSDPAP